jgi:membrane protease YdiL (CAAX protease family)
MNGLNDSDYCGKENDGASLPAPPLLPPPLPPPPVLDGPPQLRAGRATLVLLSLLAGQIGATLLAGFALVLVEMAQGQMSSGMQATSAFTEKLMPVAIPAAMVGGGVAMFLAAVFMLGKHLKDTSPFGAAWTLGSRKRLLEGFGVGMLAAGLYLVVCIGPASRVDQSALGPLAQMASTPGPVQITWLVIALVFAPITEEPLFRGILYGGYRRSFGPVAAALLTTSIFFLLHITEMMYFWPSAIGITSLALVALWLRLRSAAIGPAIAAHFAYNGVLGVLAVISTHGQH